MELKKTTVLASFVCIAGILAQIMFHDILSKDIFGVVISIVLAVIILISFYFVFDGIECLLQQIKDRDIMHQKEYEKRLYNILSEQIKFQKATYSEVKDIQQTQEAQQMSELVSEKEESHNEPVEVKFPDNLVYEENMEQIKQEINDNTAMSVEQMKQELSDNTAMSVAQIKENISDNVTNCIEQLKQEINDNSVMSVGQMKQEINACMETSAEQMKQEINDHTTMSAKIVAKYIGRTTEEIKATLGEQDEDVKKLLLQIEENQNMILELLKKKR